VLFSAVTQHVVVIPHRRSGAIYRYLLEGSRSIPSPPLKMELLGGYEISVRNYHYMLRDSREGRNCHLLRGGSLQSRKVSNKLTRQNKIKRRIKTKKTEWRQIIDVSSLAFSFCLHTSLLTPWSTVLLEKLTGL
jgi:hypothetical protein